MDIIFLIALLPDISDFGLAIIESDQNCVEPVMSAVLHRTDKAIPTGPNDFELLWWTRCARAALNSLARFFDFHLGN